VFNFDVPSHPEDYIHRIGRTGRAGRLGRAFTIATPHDDKYLAAIEQLIKQAIPPGTVPEGALDGASDTENRPSSSSRSSASRSRSGRGSESRSAEVRPERKPEPKVDVMPVIEHEAEDEIVAEAPRPLADRSEDRRGSSRPAPDRRQSDRSDDRRYPPRSVGGDRVVGMGDHVPDFILRSFQIATLATEETEDEQVAE
jgi:superfamily II DNA/RNA helicase